jgi:2-polyprenyl-6-methoxyphenol hydroxylase-like FAD-dependent oxidoreductase
MPKIVVLGGGLCGLAAGMLLARDGHEVTLLERDDEPVPASPDDAWESWARRGVVQFRQPHFLQARAGQVLSAELPDVHDALAAAGGVVVDPLTRLPADMPGREPRPGDERLAALTGRRTTIEYVFACAGRAEPGLDVRAGVTVTGLTTRELGGTMHVTGVRTESGETVAADLVVDALGRRSPMPAWLQEAGAPPVHEEAEDCGFVYYTRFFRARNGGIPATRTGALLNPIGSMSVITLPGDRGTWAVTIFISGLDRPLKRLRFPAAWEAAIAACPLQAHWLDGDPISDVLPMGGVIDRYRRLARDGRPIATGVALVGDAWACTNPSLGRGIALGLHHASRLRDTVREHGDDPTAFATAWDDLTETELTPWYRATVAADRARLAEIVAIREGRDVPAPVDPPARLRAALPVAARHDADVYRALMEIVGVLTLPQEVLSRPGLAERVLALADEHGTPPPAGPSRDELLGVVAAAAPG